MLSLMLLFAVFGFCLYLSIVCSIRITEFFSSAAFAYGGSHTIDFRAAIWAKSLTIAVSFSRLAAILTYQGVLHEAIIGLTY